MTVLPIRWATLVAISLVLAIATSGAQSASRKDDGVRVRVSRRELRAEFHTDTTRAWGWSGGSDPTYLPRYLWSVDINGMDGPRFLMVDLSRDTLVARTFPSL